MTNALMPCKLETMIYDCGDGTYSVFTLNPVLQKQLANLAVQHPKMPKLFPASSYIKCNNRQI